jgi:uroporphyrinogen-III synthase
MPLPLFEGHRAMRVVVTRPEREAQAWLQALSAAGHDAVGLPLIAFAPVFNTPLPTDTLPMPYEVLMFVSAQAVDSYFYNKKSTLSLDFIDNNAIIFDKLFDQKTRFWAPGPGTARALQAVGVPPDRIDQPDPEGGQFDSEALWQVAAPRLHAGDRVLIVRGDSDRSDDRSHAPTAASVSTGQGRDWLAQQCQTAGAQVTYRVAYRRVRPNWTAAQQAQAQQALGGAALWLFSSAEGVSHLPHLLAGVDWQPALALATHPRVAQAARHIGFGTVTVCRPTVADVLTAVTQVALGRKNGS